MPCDLERGTYSPKVRVVLDKLVGAAVGALD
jgi:hypothetical protein